MATRVSDYLELSIIPRIVRYYHNKRLKFKDIDEPYPEYKQLQREEFGTSPSSSDKNWSDQFRFQSINLLINK